MKVLHYGLILNQPWDISRGLREIGIGADCALWDTFEQDWLIPGVDINLKMNSVLNQKDRMDSFVNDVINKYDIVHFHSRPTFWYNDFFDFKIIETIKEHGLGCFISFWGCDARDVSREKIYRWSPCKLCARNQQKYCNIVNTATYTISKKYCDAMFSVADICQVNNDIWWMDLAVNTELPPVFKIPEQYMIPREDDEIIIYHSFGNSKTRKDVKGSIHIKKTIDNLIKNGYKIKYIFVDNILNKDLKYIQCQSDIVIDQIRAGWYGVTAVECMALGKPVMSYLRRDNLEICPNKDIPVINVNPSTLKRQLKHAIDNFGEMLDVGRHSGDYVKKYHDRKVIAQKLSNYYKECG